MLALQVQPEGARSKVCIADVAGHLATMSRPYVGMPFQSIVVRALCHGRTAWDADHNLGLLGVHDQSDAFKQAHQLTEGNCRKTGFLACIRPLSA